MPAPHGNCDPSAFNYTYEDCRVTCIRSAFPDHCNCKSPADYIKYPADRNLTFCISATLPRDVVLDYYKCAGRAYPHIVAKCSEVCKEHCREVRYKTRVSYTNWPLPHQYSSFYHKLIKDKPYAHKLSILNDDNNNSSNNNSNSSDINTNSPHTIYTRQLNSMVKRQLVEDNFLKIDFSLSNKAYKEYVEVPKFSAFSFLGALGGVLNLWTGITAIIFIEFIEAFINMINSSTMKNTRNDSKSESKANTSCNHI